MKKLILVVIALAMTLLMSGCSEHYTDDSMIALRYAGGIGEGGSFKECVQPGEKQVSDDSYYNYPTTQRQDLWDSGNNAADHQDLEVTSKDGVPMYVNLNVNFGLVTDCKTLKKFHDTIGRTRKAYFNADGSYNSGWIDVMNYYISPAVISRMRTEVAKYNASELWPNTAKLTDIQATVQGDPASTNSLQYEVDRLTEGDEQFYNRLTVNLYAIKPSEEFQQLYTERQQAQTKAETAKANETAQVAQARADGAVQVAQAKAKAAAERQSILAYKLSGMSMAQAVRAYNEAQLIAAGGNPYQPSYMYPGGSGQ